MSKNINKMSKLLRVWIAAISVLTVTGEVQASSSVVDSLPKLDIGKKLNSPGRKPAKYIIINDSNTNSKTLLSDQAGSQEDYLTSTEIRRIEQVQNVLEDIDNISDLTWDDSADSMFYGREKAILVAEAKEYNKSIEEWSFDKDADLVLNALSYYPDQPDASNVSDIVASTCDKADMLLAHEIPRSVLDGISDEELELSISEAYDILLITTPANEDTTTTLSIADTTKGKLEYKPAEQNLTVMLNESDKQLSEKVQEWEAGTAELIEVVGATGEVNTEQEGGIKSSLDIQEVQNSSSEEYAGIELASCSISHNANILVASIDKRFYVGISRMGTVSAGDEDLEDTVLDNIASFYINPFIGNATQKTINKLSNYHSRSKGAIIGYDACFNDSMQLGVSVTKAASKLSFTNNKLGDRAKVISNFYSLYGLYMPSNQNIFISGIGIYGISDISSKARRYADTTATSNHKAYSNIVQVMLGSNFNLTNSIRVNPMLGMKYSKIRDASYEEEGALAYNLSVSRAKEKVVEAVIGFNLSSSKVIGNSVSITPKVYAFAYKNIQSQLSSINASLAEDGTLLPPFAINRSKLSFSYGAGITVRNRICEFGINYNGNAANKYISHSGSIKLKIKL